MSNPPDNLRLRALLEQAVATGNAAIIERDRLKAINADLLQAMQMMVQIAAEAHIHWDNDRDAKVGKLLIAMSDKSFLYDHRITSIHKAISKSLGETP